MDGAITHFGSKFSTGVPLPPTGTFASAVVGSGVGCGKKKDETLFCWGSYPSLPGSGVKDLPGGAFSDVSMHGGTHACARRGAGSIACWGLDLSGETQAPTGAFVNVAAAHGYTCGTRTDGTVACWGDNTYGQALPPPALTLAH
ncbi:MAG: hypothetical protein IPG50_06155 [Myxococcales bacterium]|nr:hypothetical protein [Myxococcales bacterium]